MRKTCATILILSIATPSLFAEGPIARSIAAEASRLAEANQTATAPPGWRAVERLDTETPIVVSTPTGSIDGHFVFADAGGLTVFTPAQSRLPGEIERRLRAAIEANPGAVAAAAVGGSKLVDEFRIGVEGVFVGDRKVAERSNVLRQIRIADVVAVSRKRWRGDVNLTTGAAVLGALAGGLLGLMMFYDTAGPGAAIGVVAVPIGTATAAGYGVWHGTRTMADEVIYRAPARP